ncbi:MAG: BamA/TamA family outer membrane protein [Silvanigrellales bacterium]|nr:BamA/TamA family outer membrane protein [Silvanigrellales bacterium]
MLSRRRCGVESRGSLFLFSCLFVFVLVFVSLSGTAFAQGLPEGPSASASVSFFVEGKEQALPPDALARLVGVSAEQYPNEVVLAVAATGRFRNISVRASAAGPEGRPAFRVDALRQRRVSDVNLSGLGFLEDSQYKRILKSRVGAPFVEEDLLEDVSRLKRRLADRGYLNAKVNTPVTETSEQDDVRISFDVERERPCRVAEITVEPDASVFDFITSPVEPGSLCDVIGIEDSLERAKSKLRSEGFLDADLRLVSIRYTSDQERAVVRLRVDRGRRTRIEVVNAATGAVSDESLQGRGGLSPAELVYLSEEELRSEIQSGYLKRGYASAVVTGPNKYTAQGDENVFRYFVQPGIQVFVGRIDFRGDLPLARAEVIEKLGLAPSLFSSRVSFVEAEMSRTREKLLAIYYDEGFADAKVEGPSVSFSTDGRQANLVFRVQPGPRYVVRDLTVLGKPSEFDPEGGILKENLGLGAPVSKGRLRILEDDTRIELMKLGYAYATVKAEPNVMGGTEASRHVQILLTIDSGPVVTIGKVYAEGELYGKGDRVISETGLETGDLFTPDNLDQGRLRVLKHDLFGNVQVEPLDPGALAEKKQVIDVVVRTQQRAGYSLGLGPGYGTRNGYRFAIDFARNNLTRDGLRLTSSAVVSQEKQQRAFNDTRQLLGRKISVGVVEPLARVGQWVSPFDVSTVSGLEVASQALSNRFFETFEVGLSYKPYFWDVSWNFYGKFAHEWSKVIGSGLEPIEALDRPTLRIHEIVAGVSVDTRNNVEWPTSGSLIDLSSSHARFGLYSEVQYDRVGFDMSQYFPVYGRFSGAIGGGISRISNIVNEKRETVTAPGSRRNSLSGRAQVRGFPDGGAGLGPLIWLDLRAPRANPDLNCSPLLRAIGATNVIYLKTEARYRSAWFDEMLGFALFMDSGTSYFTANEERAISSRLEAFNASAAKDEDTASNSCVIKGAKLVGNDAITIKDTSVVEQYLNRSYISSGAGVRIIIPNLASINIDWGFPLYDPAERRTGCQTLGEATTRGGNAPECVKRREDDKLFGVLTVPGAFYVGVGASF